MPPSMTNSLPVTKDDWSDARYRIPGAMSSETPRRPKGIWPVLACLFPVGWSGGHSIQESTSIFRVMVRNPHTRLVIAW